MYCKPADMRTGKFLSEATIKFLSKSLFGEPTWFCVVHPNLGVAMGVKGVYRSMWELRVGSGPR